MPEDSDQRYDKARKTIGPTGKMLVKAGAVVVGGAAGARGFADIIAVTGTSVAPVVGTIIGAVIGAVAGWLITDHFLD